MKEVEYAKKYSELSVSASQTLGRDRFVELINRLYQDLIDDMLADARKWQIRNEVQYNNLLNEYNKKANRINDLLGRPVKSDWFLLVANS